MFFYRMLCVIAFVFLSLPSAFAATWGKCTYNTQQFNVNIPSVIDMTVDPSLPDGTVIYRQTVNNITSPISCTSATTFNYKWGWEFASGGSTVNMSGSGLNGNYVAYKTNVEGIVLVAWFAGNVFPYYFPNDTCANCIYSNPLNQNFDFELIKYGNVPYGVTSISLSNIPKINFKFVVSGSKNTSNVPNGTITVAVDTLGGTVNMNSSTCQTPSFPVFLGEHSVHALSNRDGGKFATPWVDASISLTNCPNFKGIGGRGLQYGGISNNILYVTLSPNNPSTSSEGIMPVDSGDGAAEGIGIQIAFGIAGSNNKVDFSAIGTPQKSYMITPDNGPTITIPLVARYYQTAASVNDIKGGIANGKVTYLITYY